MECSPSEMQGSMVQRSNATPQTVGNLWTLIKSWKWKSVEKCVAYAALLISSTKGFDTIAMNPTVRTDLIVASGIIIAALHIGTDQ